MFVKVSLTCMGAELLLNIVEVPFEFLVTEYFR